MRSLARMVAIVALFPSFADADWRFTDVTRQAGFDYEHGYFGRIPTMPRQVAGGVAAGDYDGDGWTDLYIVRGAMGRAQLYQNLGNGSFAERGRLAGVDALDSLACGPLFFDFDGDGNLDLFVGAIEGGRLRLYRNRGDATFDDVTEESGLGSSHNTISASAADYDRDGWVDLFLSHWGSPAGECHLWRNLGGRFVCNDEASGLADCLAADPEDWSFTGNFVDVNGDQALDLLVTSDFGTSRVLIQLDGRFVDRTPPSITDENGMGSAVGDYDNDGDLDWFVSSIWDPNGVAEGNWGVSGNRLYRNDGGGVFEDVTDGAGVRAGYWGWAAVFADFDNDRHLDLVHVNGWPRGSTEFHRDPSVLFISNGDGTFSERSSVLGFADSAQGRGIVCFDYDRDGDLDVFVANNGGAPTMWRNDLPRGRNSLAVQLRGATRNTEGLGARVWVTTRGLTQMRQICAGTHYVSQDPAEAWFGLGDETHVTELRVQWPDGLETALAEVPAGRIMVDAANAVEPPPFGTVMVRPNPSTHGVDVIFSSPAPRGAVTSIYDIAGRLVRRLPGVEGRIVRWDGTDSEGRRAPSGLYWVDRASGLGRTRARIVRLL